MAEQLGQAAGMFCVGPGWHQGQPEQNVIFLLDVDAMPGVLSSSPSADDKQSPEADNAASSAHAAEGKLKPEQLMEVLSRVSQILTHLHDLPTAVSYHIISTKNKFILERLRELKPIIAARMKEDNDALGGAAGSSAPPAEQRSGGSGGGLETRTPRHVHAEMLALLKALGDQPPGAAPSASGAESSNWLPNIFHHVQQTASRFLTAMQTAATQRGGFVQTATFVVVTPAPPPGASKSPTEPLNVELQSALRQANARFLWLDPSGSQEVPQRARMESAVAAAAKAVASGEADVAGASAAPPEEQLALLLSSHWRGRQEFAAQCMAPHPRTALPLLPVAWLPVKQVLTSKVVLETMMHSLLAHAPPGTYLPLPPDFKPSEHAGYKQKFLSGRWSYIVWMETHGLCLDLLKRLDVKCQPLLRLPPLKISVEPHKAAAAAKAAPASGVKGAWQKRGGPPGSQNPHSRPPMAPPAHPAAMAAGGRAGSVPGRPMPLAASAQLNVPAGAGGRQPLKPGLGAKPGGSHPGSRPQTGSAGPGGVSRPGSGSAGGANKAQQNKASKPPPRPPAEAAAAAAAAAGGGAGGGYTLGRAAGKRIAQALEQGTIAGAGAAGGGAKPGTDSQGGGAAAAAAGDTAAAGLGGGGGAGACNNSRWVWPPLSPEEVAALAARESGMVAVDDELDVAELLRRADEQMHDFISGDLKAAIRRDEKQLRRNQKQPQEQQQQQPQQQDVQQRERQQGQGMEAEGPQQAPEPSTVAPDAAAEAGGADVVDTDGPAQQGGDAAGATAVPGPPLPAASGAPAAREEGHGQAGGEEADEEEERNTKRPRVVPLKELQPVLGDARSRLRSKLLVAPPKLSRHEQQLPGWQPPLDLILQRSREHTRTVVDALLRASERGVSVAMKAVRRQAAERKARAKQRSAGGGALEDMGEECGEVDPDMAPGADEEAAGDRAGQGEDAADKEDGVYAAAIDQVFALLQEAWASDVMAVLRERGAVKGRPRLQLCALLYSASRLIHAVEMLGYRRRSPRLLVDLLREQLDWAVPLLWHVAASPDMATFVTERLKPPWEKTMVSPLLELLAVSYAGEDREGNNEMEFVARWDSDEDWEAGMEQAGGVEASTGALEELQRAAAAAAAAAAGTQQGSQLGASDMRPSGRATSASHGFGHRNAAASGGGTGMCPGATGRAGQASGSGRPGAGSGAAGFGAGVQARGGAHASAGGRGGPSSQAQVMEVDSLRGVVVAGAPRAAGAGRMAKHVTRLDPTRPAHMMPQMMARPIIQVAPEPPPERLAAMREEHRLKQRCGAATTNLADLFDKEVAPPPAGPAAAAAAAAPAVAATAAGPSAAARPAPAARGGPQDRRRPAEPAKPAKPAVGSKRPRTEAAGAGNRAVAARALGGMAAASPIVKGSPACRPAASESSTEVGPTPMDEQGGGRHRSRLDELGGLGLAKGLFTEADGGEAPVVKYNPGGEGPFGQVATFQVVVNNKPRPPPAAAPSAEAAAAAAAAAASALTNAAASGLFVFGAGPSAAAGVGAAHDQPNDTGTAAPPAAAAPDGDVLRTSGGGASAAGAAAPVFAAAPVVVFGGSAEAPQVPEDAGAAAAYGDAAGEAYGDEDNADAGDSPPTGCRMQAEEHSADSRGCRPVGDDEDLDSDAEHGSDDGGDSPTGAKRPPKQPVPDACSPCKSKGTSTTAPARALAPMSRAVSRIPGFGTAAAGSGMAGAAPGSRKAPMAAAAAAAAAAARRPVRPALARAPGAKPAVAAAAAHPPPASTAAADMDAKDRRHVHVVRRAQPGAPAPGVKGAAASQPQSQQEAACPVKLQQPQPRKGAPPGGVPSQRPATGPAGSVDIGVCVAASEDMQTDRAEVQGEDEGAVGSRRLSVEMEDASGSGGPQAEQKPSAGMPAAGTSTEVALVLVAEAIARDSALSVAASAAEAAIAVEALVVEAHGQPELPQQAPTLGSPLADSAACHTASKRKASPTGEPGASPAAAEDVATGAATAAAATTSASGDGGSEGMPCSRGAPQLSPSVSGRPAKRRHRGPALLPVFENTAEGTDTANTAAEGLDSTRPHEQPQTLQEGGGATEPADMEAAPVAAAGATQEEPRQLVVSAPLTPRHTAATDGATATAAGGGEGLPDEEPAPTPHNPVRERTALGYTPHPRGNSTRSRRRRADPGPGLLEDDATGPEARGPDPLPDLAPRVLDPVPEVAEAPDGASAPAEKAACAPLAVDPDSAAAAVAAPEVADRGASASAGQQQAKVTTAEEPHAGEGAGLEEQQPQPPLVGHAVNGDLLPPLAGSGGPRLSLPASPPADDNAVAGVTPGPSAGAEAVAPLPIISPAAAVDEAPAAQAGGAARTATETESAVGLIASWFGAVADFGADRHTTATAVTAGLRIGAPLEIRGSLEGTRPAAGPSGDVAGSQAAAAPASQDPAGEDAGAGPATLPTSYKTPAGRRAEPCLEASPSPMYTASFTGGLAESVKLRRQQQKEKAGTAASGSKQLTPTTAGKATASAARTGGTAQAAKATASAAKSTQRTPPGLPAASQGRPLNTRNALAAANAEQARVSSGRAASASTSKDRANSAQRSKQRTGGSGATTAAAASTGPGGSAAPAVSTGGAAAATSRDGPPPKKRSRTTTDTPLGSAADVMTAPAGGAVKKAEVLPAGPPPAPGLVTTHAVQGVTAGVMADGAAADDTMTQTSPQRRPAGIDVADADSGGGTVNTRRGGRGKRKQAEEGAAAAALAELQVEAAQEEGQEGHQQQQQLPRHDQAAAGSPPGPAGVEEASGSPQPRRSPRLVQQQPEQPQGAGGRAETGAASELRSPVEARHTRSGRVLGPLVVGSGEATPSTRPPRGGKRPGGACGNAGEEEAAGTPLTETKKRRVK